MVDKCGIIINFNINIKQQGHELNIFLYYYFILSTKKNYIQLFKEEATFKTSIYINIKNVKRKIVIEENTINMRNIAEDVPVTQ